MCHLHAFCSVKNSKTDAHVFSFYHVIVYVLKCEARNDLKSMPYLVYWFDLSLKSGLPQITLEPCGTLFSMEFGERLGLDRLPKAIEMKLRRMEDLTSEENLACDVLNAYDKAKESRSPPFVIQPDDALYTVFKVSSANNLLVVVPQKQQKVMPMVGQRLKVLWETVSSYYYGVVKCIRGDFYFLVYDDNETQWLPLADHTFEVVPMDEGKSALLLARAEDPRWHSDLPAETAQQKLNIETTGVANQVSTGKTEWHDKTPKQNQTSRQTRKYTPKKDKNGFFKRPVGRAPSGCEWK